MKQILSFIFATVLLMTAANAQENLRRGSKAQDIQKTFTIIKELPITCIKNQNRSGTCWDFAALGFFESSPMEHWQDSVFISSYNTSINHHELNC